MEVTFQEKVIHAYEEGHLIDSIVRTFNTTEEAVLKTLREFRDSQRASRRFTDRFKQVVANRDTTGISRTMIASELDINVNTVKKACKAFGQEYSEKRSFDNTYTRIDGVFGTDQCVECHSKDYKEVSDDTYYCRKCGNEYLHHKDHALKVNWEYVD